MSIDGGETSAYIILLVLTGEILAQRAQRTRWAITQQWSTEIVAVVEFVGIGVKEGLSKEGMV